MKPIHFVFLVLLVTLALAWTPNTAKQPLTWIAASTIDAGGDADTSSVFTLESGERMSAFIDLDGSSIDVDIILLSTWSHAASVADAKWSWTDEDGDTLWIKQGYTLSAQSAAALNPVYGKRFRFVIIGNAGADLDSIKVRCVYQPIPGR
jgi:hypothetical protein